MEEYIIVKLLNNFKFILENLKAIEIEDPLDYLKKVVEELKTQDDSRYFYNDCEQSSNFLKKVNKIKDFFKDEKHKTLKSIILYLVSIKIPSAEELSELAKIKMLVEEIFFSIDINKVILNSGNYDAILDDFNDFREIYSNLYIRKHEEINSLRGIFSEHLITSSQFILLSNLSSIDQIRQTLLNPPIKIKSDIQLIRNQKCPLSKDNLSERLEKNPVCSSCNMKFEELYDDQIMAFLDTNQQQIKQSIDKSLLSALKIVKDKKDKIKEILAEEKYNSIDNLINFFDANFEFFNNIANDSERITQLGSLADNLYSLYSDQVLEVILKAFSEEPVTIVIDLVIEIVKIMESKLYTEEELITEFNEKIELVKENKKQEKLEELGLGLDDDKPIIHFIFKKV